MTTAPARTSRRHRHDLAGGRLPGRRPRCSSARTPRATRPRSPSTTSGWAPTWCSVHRPELPGRDRRVTIGVDPVTEVFTLLKLGQVTGVVVNSLDRRPAARQLHHPALSPARRTRTNRAGDRRSRSTEPDADGNIFFQSPPTSLVTGRYRVEVLAAAARLRRRGRPAPRPASPRGAEIQMMFEIRPEDEDVIRLNPIEADPLPRAAPARVFVPSLRERHPPTSTSYPSKPRPDELDGHRSTCPAGPDEVATGPAHGQRGRRSRSRHVRVRPPRDPGSTLLGQCTLTVAADGYTHRQHHPDDDRSPRATARPAATSSSTSRSWPRPPSAARRSGSTPPRPPSTRTGPRRGVGVRVDGPVIIGFDESQRRSRRPAHAGHRLPGAHRERRERPVASRRSGVRTGHLRLRGPRTGSTPAGSRS